MDVLTQTVGVNETSTSALPSGGRRRLGSRRARAACALCRWRKVRCDAEEGQPCSNCKFEGVQCVLTQKRRRRKSTTYVPPTSLERGPTDSLVEVLSTPQLPSINSQEPRPASTAQAEVLQQAYSPSLHSYSDGSPSGNVTLQPSSTNINLHAASTQTPPYLKPVPPHLGTDDAEYLYRKGALSVPESELRDALLQSYIEFIHPCLPILDLCLFQACIEDPAQYGQISFLLFQAVMFAGAAWVDIRLLRKLGFLTRKAARKALYQKARLLYDSDYEQDRMSLVQTLVLLTLWWEGPNEQKDGWHWCGVYFSMARTIGLNRDSASQNLDPSMRRLRRRIWWSCLLRDAISSFGLNRQPRIKDADYDVSALTMDDFDIQEPQSDATKWAVPRELSQQRKLATIFIEMSKLCRIISMIQHVAYAEDTIARTETMYSNQELNDGNIPSPVQNQIDSRKLSLCEEDLQRWREEVPEEVLHVHPSPTPTEAFEQAPLLHQALLSLLYFTALLSIHRPRALASDGNAMSVNTPSQNHQNASSGIVRYAAAQCTEVVMDLYRADLARLLPAAGISCIIPACISHINDLKSADDTIRREGQQRLEQCKQVLRELSDAHIAAEWTINFLCFVELRIRRKGTDYRRLTGMMSAEIRWSMPALYTSNFPQTMSPISDPIQWNESHTDVQPTAAALATNTELSETIKAGNGHSEEASEATNGEIAKPAGSTSPSPDDYANMINFPEMWLDLAGSSSSLLDMDWIEDNQTSMNLE